MITLENRICVPDTYPLERLGSLEELLFFDIETTGFSGGHSSLYLIGCTYLKAGSWYLTQWFADTKEAEPEILCAFFRFLENFTTVIHFNGDGFDIPFLLKRCRFHNLPYHFTNVTSIDLYKKIRPYKNLLGLHSLKQKTIEQFLGIGREDQYTGGQLIEVYQDYLITHDQRLFDLLILHNEEDLKGMPLILPILNYPDFINHDFKLLHHVILKQQDTHGTCHPALRMTLISEYEIPVPFARSKAQVTLDAQSHQLNVTIDLYEGVLKHFYTDYKNYYYLIYEDHAIHKSVAEYVDKGVRIKATAKNCYTKMDGCYLPQFTPLWKPYLQTDYKAEPTYVPFTEEFFQNRDSVQTYIKHLFAVLLK